MKLRTMISVSMTALLLTTGYAAAETVRNADELPSPSVIAKPHVNSLSSYDIERSYDNMTSVQWSAYTTKIRNTSVCWTGSVDDVDHGWFSGNTMWVNMGSSGRVRSMLAEVSDADAMRDKGSRISWCGYIDRVWNILGAISITFNTYTIK